MGSKRAFRIHPAAGFSLTELMIVLTIAGILFTMAVPNFVRLTSRDRVESAAYDVHRTLILARQKALAGRTSYRITILPGGTSLRVERRVDGAWVPDPAEDILIHESVQLTTEFGGDPDNADMVIEPQGTVLAEDAPALFRFSNERADSALVRAVRTGRIRTRTM
ncbi:MAG: prepilin-type N-terminal cleavage/methylation domain-containing protein [Candidatus Eisenbacteria bacterium]